MNIQPLGKNVLVAENKKSETTAGGIIIEGVGTHESKSATVLAVGPEVTSVQVNDVIFLDWSNGNIIKTDGAQRVIIKEEDVLAIVR